MLEIARQLGILAAATALLIGGQAVATGHADHADFDAILKTSVDDGYVDYPRIAADPRFPDYVEALAAPLPADASRDEQLAFYINAYNALAIRGILDGQSPSSLLGRYKYFKGTEYDVGGQHMNLYDLERKVIIPFGEPRIHFAIVCASASCPPLRAEAYTAERLEAQLEEQARAFLTDTSKNYFEPDRRRARLSRIFDWFPEDFAGHSGSVQQYIAQYVTDPGIAAALRVQDYKIKYLKYDWSLNGIEP
jgi:hypothetical protein